MLIIERCVKKPGVLVGARTYQLILADEGLYVFELGKAMGHRSKGNPIADRILDRMEKKRQAQHEERAAAISGQDLAAMVDDKKSFLIRPSADVQVSAAGSDHAPVLMIKSKALSANLHCDAQDLGSVRKIATRFA